MPPPIAFLPDQAVSGKLDVVEDDLVELMRAQHVDDRIDRHPVLVKVDEKLAEAAMAVLAGIAGTTQCDHVMIEMGVAGPHFGAD